MCGSRDGGIEPAQIFLVEQVVGHISLVDKDRGPLAALCLVTGEGIGELHLEGVEVGVFPHHAQPLRLDGHIGIVLHHGVEKSLSLFA